MVITHNMLADNGIRQLNIGEKKLEKSSRNLSSGYRINGAADDAAGLSISEKMRWQVRGLNRASANSQDGISYIQTAEGALNEMHSILNRCKELSVQAANDTNTEIDRAAVQNELDELTKEIDRISSTTQYNTLNVFSAGGASPDMASVRLAELPVIEVTLSYIDGDGNILPVDPTASAPGTAVSYTGDMETIADYAAEQAARAASQILQAYPSLLGASSADIHVGLNLAPIDGSGNVLASASLSMSWGTNISNMTYTMNVDTLDFNINNYNDGRLASTITHEMTHLIMQDTLTAGMLGQNAESYPLWFVEGMAQTASGDGGWFSNRLDSSSTDTQISNYLSQVESMPYGAGYLGTLYLSQMASGASAVSTASLRNGADTILGKMVEGYTLSQIISEISGGRYQNVNDFQNRVASDQDAIDFTRDFIAARGNGAGSVIAASLATAESNILSAGAYTTSYIVETGTTSYTNVFHSGFTFPVPGTPGGGGGGTGTGGSTLTGSGIKLQVGALAEQAVALTTFDVSSRALFAGHVMAVNDFEHASESITYIDDAIERVSKVRSYYGAMQNRLEHIVANVDNTSENVQAAESRLRDTDMAEEMVSYSSQNIINQAAQSILAQSNRMTEGVLQILNLN